MQCPLGQPHAGNPLRCAFLYHNGICFFCSNLPIVHYYDEDLERHYSEECVICTGISPEKAFQGTRFFKEVVMSLLDTK